MPINRPDHAPMEAAPYSNPLPCESCEYCLEPIEPKFSRARNLMCKKYTTLQNHKPAGVLWNNEECPHYKGKT